MWPKVGLRSIRKFYIPHCTNNKAASYSSETVLNYTPHILLSDLQMKMVVWIRLSSYWLEPNKRVLQWLLGIWGDFITFHIMTVLNYIKLTIGTRGTEVDNMICRTNILQTLLHVAYRQHSILCYIFVMRYVVCRGTIKLGCTTNCLVLL